MGTGPGARMALPAHAEPEAALPPVLHDEHQVHLVCEGIEEMKKGSLWKCLLFTATAYVGVMAVLSGILKWADPEGYEWEQMKCSDLWERTG